MWNLIFLRSTCYKKCFICWLKKLMVRIYVLRLIDIYDVNFHSLLPNWPCMSKLCFPQKSSSKIIEFKCDFKKLLASFKVDFSQTWILLNALSPTLRYKNGAWSQKKCKNHRPVNRFVQFGRLEEDYITTRVFLKMILVTNRYNRDLLKRCIFFYTHIQKPEGYQILTQKCIVKSQNWRFFLTFMSFKF